MLRAVSQIVTSNAAATRITTTATSIQRRQDAQSSASPIGVLPSCAAVVVVAPISRAIATPEALLLAGWPARLLGSQVLPHVVEELHRAIRRRLRLDVRPAARHFPGHVQRCPPFASPFQSRRRRRTTPPTPLAARVDRAAPGGVL